MTVVKICGITNLDDARHAVKCGADLLGFNFYERSPRYISPVAARDIIEKLKFDGRTVGVFVNAGVDRIYDITVTTLIDSIQLHGDESPNDVQRLKDGTRLDVIRALRIGSGSDITSVEEYGDVPILVDAFSPNSYGGTGKTADRTISKQLVDSGRTIYLAGGLTPENVREAIQTVRPFGVDVASGVESSPGLKDHQKVSAFIAAAKNAI